MPNRSEVAYFGAGPAPLPTPVIEAGAQAFVNFEDTGLSLAEISHRSPTANKILADTKEALATLYDIPTDEYDVFFMQAGGTGEFSAALQNLVGCWIERRRRKAVEELGEGKDAEVLERVKREIEAELKVDYLVTGSWSLKASQEATRLIGAKYVNVAVDARKSNNGKFGKIPDEKEWNLTPKGSALTYLCDNETVDGVEFPGFPKSLESTGAKEEDERIVVADMSSNFLSRKIDVRKYGVIFVSGSLLLLHLTRPKSNLFTGRRSEKSRHCGCYRGYHPEIAAQPCSATDFPPRAVLCRTDLRHSSAHHVLLLNNCFQQQPLQHTSDLQPLCSHHGATEPGFYVRHPERFGSTRSCG